MCKWIKTTSKMSKISAAYVAISEMWIPQIGSSAYFLEFQARWLPFVYKKIERGPFSSCGGRSFSVAFLRSFKVHLRFYRIRRLHIPRLDCIMSIYLSVFIKNFVRQWLQKVKKKRHSTKKVLILSQVETLTSLSVCWSFNECTFVVCTLCGNFFLQAHNNWVYH